LLLPGLRKHPQTATKHLFVSGGVASSLGKGLTASSLGQLLTARGLQVTMQKLDPYLNVDPGTMNPFQSRRRCLRKLKADPGLADQAGGCHPASIGLH
jgi:hypothetical protein